MKTSFQFLVFSDDQFNLKTENWELIFCGGSLWKSI